MTISLGDLLDELDAPPAKQAAVRIRTTITVKPELLARAKSRALKDGVSVSRYIENALIHFLNADA